MGYSKGDRVIATEGWDFIKKGTKGVVVESETSVSSPKIAFETGKTLKYSSRRLAKI